MRYFNTASNKTSNAFFSHAFRPSKNENQYARSLLHEIQWNPLKPIEQFSTKFQTCCDYASRSGCRIPAKVSLNQSSEPSCIISVSSFCNQGCLKMPSNDTRSSSGWKMLFKRSMALSVNIGRTL